VIRYSNIFSIVSLRFDWQSGLGSWKQLGYNGTDTFDFSTYSGRTPSYFTGPKFDHTYQEEHGKKIVLRYYTSVTYIMFHFHREHPYHIACDFI